MDAVELAVCAGSTVFFQLVFQVKRAPGSLSRAVLWRTKPWED
jgi:hypothetical protein